MVPHPDKYCWLTPRTPLGDPPSPTVHSHRTKAQVAATSKGRKTTNAPRGTDNNSREQDDSGTAARLALRKQSRQNSPAEKRERRRAGGGAAFPTAKHLLLIVELKSEVDRRHRDVTTSFSHDNSIQ